MVSAETLFSYPDWTNYFTVHMDDYGKQLGAVINQNTKTIEFLSRTLSKQKSKYTTTEKELIAIVEYLSSNSEELSLAMK